MKKNLILALLLALAIAADFNIVCDDKILAQPNKGFQYKISSVGEKGRLGYEITGLPEGLRSQGAVIAGIPKAAPGDYPITITATDAEGRVASRTAVISIGSVQTANFYINSGSVSSNTSATSANFVAYGNVFAANGQSTGKAVTSDGLVFGSNGQATGEKARPDGTIIGANGLVTGETWRVISNAGSNPSTAGSSISSISSTISSTSINTNSPVITTGTVSSVSGTTTKIVEINTSSTYAPSYPTGPQNAYPTPQYPTGPSSNFVPSNLPKQISDYTYPQNAPRDTYTPSVTEVESNAIFQRQINANKAVANLISIISTLTANVNGVQGDIPAAAAALNDALAKQRAVQARVAAAEASNKSVTITITTLKTEIQTQQDRLAGIVGDIQKANNQIDNLKANAGDIDANINNLKGTLPENDRVVIDAKNALADAQKNLDDANSAIKKNYDAISVIVNDIANQGFFVNQTESAVSGLSGRIKELEDELARLRGLLQANITRLNYYKNIDKAGPVEKARLEGENANILAKINSILQPQVDKWNKVIVDALGKSQDTRNKINDLLDKKRQNENDLAKATKNLGDLNNNYNSIAGAISSNTNNLNAVINSAPTYHNALLQAYNDGNDANDRVAHARAILEALNKKYQDSVSQLNEAKKNLEKARSEKEIADQAANEQLIKIGGPSILTYAIASNGGSTDLGGAPLGNNPSGAALGPAKNSPYGNGASNSGSNSGNNPSGNGVFGPNGQFNGDPSHYISNAMDNNLDAARLFPFTLNTLKGSNIRTGSGSCSGSKPSSSEKTAVITKINADSLEVTYNGEAWTLYLSGCTKLQANQQGYTPKVGDRVHWTGYVNAERTKVNADNLVCYRTA